LSIAQLYNSDPRVGQPKVALSGNNKPLFIIALRNLTIKKIKVAPIAFQQTNTKRALFSILYVMASL